MKLVRNVRAVSRLSLVLLLFVAAVVGALLSYLWVVGYYISLGIVVPESVTVNIANATFVPQNPSFFNVTVLNPSFSPSAATITGISVLTEDGAIYDVAAVSPTLPYELARGKSETFFCPWSWANHTGESVGILILLKDGSGATFQTKTPLVDLSVGVGFGPAMGITRFNVTVQNSASSVTYVNITRIRLDVEDIPPQNVTPSLPYTIHPGEETSFICNWNWTKHEGKRVSVTAYTSQGYLKQSIITVPVLATLEITEVAFNATDTSHFGVTLYSAESSFIDVNVAEIRITLENGTTRKIIETRPLLRPPYTLHPGDSVTFICTWNWTNYQDRNVTITVYTLQGYEASHIQKTPSPSPKSLEALPQDTLLSMVRAHLSKGQSFSITYRNRCPN